MAHLVRSFTLSTNQVEPKRLMDNVVLRNAPFTSYNVSKFTNHRICREQCAHVTLTSHHPYKQQRTDVVLCWICWKQQYRFAGSGDCNVYVSGPLVVFESPKKIHFFW